MKPEMILTIDVEKDKRGKFYFKEFEEHLNELKGNKIILFVVPELLIANKQGFRKLIKKYEIGLHGYKHERWNVLSLNEKKKRLASAVLSYKKVFGKKPKWFRAPQFSSDFELIELLEKNGFAFDSSIVQCPVSQAIFFPKRFFLYIKQCKFANLIKKKRMKIKEIPVSSYFLPVSMFSLRILPFFKFYFVAKFSLLFRKDKKLVFLAHSYEFDAKRTKKLKRFLELFKK